MLNKSAIFSINFYQKYISPNKGYCCAYKYYSTKDSCSEFAKKSFMKYGFIKSIMLTKIHLKKCKEVHFYIEKNKLENEKKNKEESYCQECAIMPASCL